MNATVAEQDSRIDRLYALLPAIYRMRDAEQGYPLKALLRVIAEQVNLLDDDIEQLYENWFIETAADWAVPYLGELVGYRPVVAAALPTDAPTLDSARWLVPRREIANLIRYRRRKGTLAVLEELSRDVAGWPARAVEFFKLLGRAQHLNHLHLQRHSLADVHDVAALELLETPFATSTRSVDVRRVTSAHTRGRYNIPSVGVFVWRLRSYPVTRTPAYCVEESGPHCYTFSVLGQDAPLFAKPLPETDPTHIAEEQNLPVPIRRRVLERDLQRFYGVERAFMIWVDGWAGVKSGQPVPASALISADLSKWEYVPPLKHIAVDPVLGRLVFPPGQLPRKGVHVSYRYGFSADLGGGEYTRPQLEAAPDAIVYKVGAHGQYRRIAEALTQWKQDKPANAVIELTASGVYVEPLHVHLDANQSLQLRAAPGTRPVIRMIDWQTDLPDALSVALEPGARLTLEGLLITGRPLRISGLYENSAGNRQVSCASRVVIRHCTLVPGWGIDCNCEPDRPAEPSLEIHNLRASVSIEHSIVGSIQIQEDEVRRDPLPLSITDSILDATAPQRQAIAAPGGGWAHASLTILRSTVFGILDVHSMLLAENCIFSSCVNVARRQLGCMRFCYVPTGCRTPRRYRCQPDGAVAAVQQQSTDPIKQAALIAGEQTRVRPQFNSVRYGKPSYAQLADTCATEIKRGADDECELGVFHQLFQPQREATLRARLEEFTPASMEVGIFFAS